MSERICSYFGVCSGCAYSGNNRTLEKSQKLQHLHSLLESLGVKPDITPVYHDVPAESRDRLDFTINGEALGLWSHSKQEITDIKECLLMTPEVSKFYLEFRQIKWPIAKGSFRLRVGPTGLRGAWLDFANLDIKKLLESESEFRKLMAISDTVEIGQKHKTLVEDAKKLKLVESELHPWWETLCNNEKVPLYSSIGAFTQPSRISNFWILDQIQKWISGGSILELGSGIGNMTLALAGNASIIYAIENDPANLQALKLNVNQYHQNNIEIKEIDFHRASPLPQAEILLANPARSGVGKHIGDILGQVKPKTIIYMSCFPASWARDSKDILADGYRLQEVILVNQFPLSSHYEILSLFSR